MRHSALLHRQSPGLPTGALRVHHCGKWRHQTPCRWRRTHKRTEVTRVSSSSGFTVHSPGGTLAGFARKTPAPGGAGTGRGRAPGRAARGSGRDRPVANPWRDRARQGRSDEAGRASSSRAGCGRRAIAGRGSLRRRSGIRRAIRRRVVREYRPGARGLASAAIVATAGAAPRCVGARAGDAAAAPPARRKVDPILPGSLRSAVANLSTLRP